VLITAPLLSIVLWLALIAGAALVAAYTMHPPPTRDAIDHLLRQTFTSYAGLMAVTALIYLALMVAIFILLPKRGPASFASYFKPVRVSTFLLAALSGAAFAYFVLFSLGYLTVTHVVAFHVTAEEKAMTPHSAAELWYAAVGIALAAPLVEELYFRGIMLRWLADRMPLFLAAIPTALIFAAIHFRFETHAGLEGIVLTAGLFLFGLLAAFWAGRWSSVWPSFAAHAMYNFTLIALPVLLHP
jgi:membrane protease YdiL (CAAX protease family)